ncbi:hypothetical protein R1flu_021700 [Riccia fluitans]|uniref:Reverse transcriptase domain-containing protein n=1 Tax=Riccia fluitans TaxID=41844 RepID=A0ABD1ZRA8_9MARC
MFFGFQFRETLADHFSPLQFGIAMLGGCETIIHGLRATLDLHPDWIVLQVDIQSAFNTVSREALFRELCAAIGSLDQLFPFVHFFYACHSPLYFSHCFREDEVSLLLSESGTGRKILWMALFLLLHIYVLLELWHQSIYYVYFHPWLMILILLDLLRLSCQLFMLSRVIFRQ